MKHLITLPLNLIRRLVSSIQLNLIERPAPNDFKLIRELRSNIRNLPTRAIREQSLAEDAWAKVVNRLDYQIIHEDPRKFLQWENLATMFVGNEQYVAEELYYLKQHPQWAGRWREAIVESEIGRPPRYPAYPQSSGNLIHHAYHLAQFEEQTGRRINEMDFIVEFGGGYGGMCRLVHKLGFNGRYVIFDLAEFSCLQSFFLKSLGLPVRSLELFEHESSGIFNVSDTDVLRDVTSACSRESLHSLFLATWSISETSIPFREEILGMVMACDAFLIAYQDKFGEVDNVEFFSNLQLKRADIVWCGWEMPHIRGNRYLIGERAVASSDCVVRNEENESNHQCRSA